ncbi:OsmC family protein [Vineibacter terrae]|uniref:OsmC family protein n=1 Tax=Vineibacter terrae TaxID=2586908 RepID=A0A5C8PAF1_9HYPH|nr:OsmC family protein [Vineibacter terrae]TXL70002.1 OsmC family protein [Vineibacter terrae]
MSTTARITWAENALFVGESGSGHTVTMDGAPDVGGHDLAARPMEMVLIGMGGCTAIDVVSMLKKQRQDVRGMAIELVAERAEEPPKVFTQVKLIYRMRGKGLNRALIERAVALSEDKYCSATAMIRKTATVTHEVVLEEVT